MTVNGIEHDAAAQRRRLRVQRHVRRRATSRWIPTTTPVGCGDVYVHGTYSQSLTIASEKDVIVDGDITRNGDALLGLIANNFVRVYHPVPQPRLQQLLHERHGHDERRRRSTPRSSRCSTPSRSTTTTAATPLGKLTVNGVIAQKFRGPVGRGSGNSKVNGYTKRYNYDDRLRFRSPPHFLDPVQSAWRIARYTEQMPPL